MAKASWSGKIIAESNATVVVEGNQYFPPETVKKEADRFLSLKLRIEFAWSSSREDETVKGDEAKADPICK